MKRSLRHSGGMRNGHNSLSKGQLKPCACRTQHPVSSLLRRHDGSVRRVRHRSQPVPVPAGGLREKRHTTIVDVPNLEGLMIGSHCHLETCLVAWPFRRPLHGALSRAQRPSELDDLKHAAKWPQDSASCVSSRPSNLPTDRSRSTMMTGAAIQFCALLLALFPIFANARDVASEDAVMRSRGGLAGRQGSLASIIRVHSGPVFLGCVYSNHECEHRAHARGFYNHFTEHDHDTCHHGPSYACYGQ